MVDVVGKGLDWGYRNDTVRAGPVDAGLKGPAK